MLVPSLLHAPYVSMIFGSRNLSSCLLFYPFETFKACLFATFHALDHVTALKYIEGCEQHNQDWFCYTVPSSTSSVLVRYCCQLRLWGLCSGCERRHDMAKSSDIKIKAHSQKGDRRGRETGDFYNALCFEYED